MFIRIMYHDEAFDSVHFTCQWLALRATTNSFPIPYKVIKMYRLRCIAKPIRKTRHDAKKVIHIAFC